MKFQVCPVLHYTKNARSQTLTITLTKAVTDADGKKAYDLTNCQSVGTERLVGAGAVFRHTVQVHW